DERASELDQAADSGEREEGRVGVESGRDGKAARMRFALGLVSMMTMSGAGVTPEVGVSERLAQERAANISDVRYALSFHSSEKRAEPGTGVVTIRFRLRSAGDVVIDFEQPRDHVGEVKINDALSEFAFVNGHIVAPANAMVAGDNSIEIPFTAGDEALN